MTYSEIPQEARFDKAKKALTEAILCLDIQLPESVYGDVRAKYDEFLGVLARYEKEQLETWLKEEREQRKLLGELHALDSTEKQEKLTAANKQLEKTKNENGELVADNLSIREDFQRAYSEKTIAEKKLEDAQKWIDEQGEIVKTLNKQLDQYRKAVGLLRIEE